MKKITQCSGKIRQLEKQWTTRNKRLTNANLTKTGSMNSVFQMGVHSLHYVRLLMQQVK